MARQAEALQKKLSQGKMLSAEELSTLRENAEKVAAVDEAALAKDQALKAQQDAQVAATSAELVPNELVKQMNALEAANDELRKASRCHPGACHAPRMPTPSRQ